MRGAFVVTSADASPTRNAAVVVRGQTVVEVIDWAGARSRFPAAEVIGSESAAVMPGLINAHHHSHAVTWIQHGLREQPLEPYLLGFPAVRRLWPLPGCTDLRGAASVDRRDRGRRPLQRRRQMPRASRATCARSSADIARRVCAWRSLPASSTQSFLVYGEGEDERFIESLPPELKSAARGLVPAAEPRARTNTSTSWRTSRTALPAGSRVSSSGTRRPVRNGCRTRFLQRHRQAAEARDTDSRRTRSRRSRQGRRAPAGRQLARSAVSRAGRPVVRASASRTGSGSTRRRSRSSRAPALPSATTRAPT